MDRWSGFPSLLPFLEQGPLYQAWNNGPTVATDVAPWNGGWQNTTVQPVLQQVAGLLCPSDSVFGGAAANGQTNYAFCAGDDWNSVDSNNPRGVFGMASRARFGDVSDGLSNTLLVGEILHPRGARQGGDVANNVSLTTPLDCLAKWDASLKQYNVNTAVNSAADWGRGARYGDGGSIYTAFTTILPSNAPSCVIDGEVGNGILSAMSNHTGGVQVLLGDGSVRFVSENINTGTLSATPAGGQSVYGVWGALGSKSGGEPVSDF